LYSFIIYPENEFYKPIEKIFTIIEKIFSKGLVLKVQIWYNEYIR